MFEAVERLSNEAHGRVNAIYRKPVYCCIRV